MTASKRIDAVFEKAPEIELDDFSKIVLMSDVHRGDNSLADDFAHNQSLYFAALQRYYNDGFTYIELGDGDELWSNRRVSAITDAHGNVFWLLSKFYKEGRYYAVFGNHDICKRKQTCKKNNFSSYYNESEQREEPLFENIRFHEGIVLRYDSGKIHLIHGHQADFINCRMWRLSRFLVRYLWRCLELIGVNDPFSAAHSRNKKEKVGQKLADWARSRGKALIVGHTHRAAFPRKGEPPYFNDGCCVHRRCVTGIEIERGRISLIKWSVKTKDDGAMYVGRDVLEGPRPLKEFL